MYFPVKPTPHRPPDAYHTCYNLAGLSAAQHQVRHVGSTDASTTSPLTAGFRWAHVRDASEEAAGKGAEGGSVLALNPVYVIPLGLAEAARQKCEGVPLDNRSGGR